MKCLLFTHFPLINYLQKFIAIHLYIAHFSFALASKDEMKKLNISWVRILHIFHLFFNLALPLVGSHLHPLLHGREKRTEFACGIFSPSITQPCAMWWEVGEYFKNENTFSFRELSTISYDPISKFYNITLPIRFTVKGAFCSFRTAFLIYQIFE